MKKTLRISDALALPDTSVTATFGLLAVRGAGKSNAGAVMFEEMFAAGLPCVAVDPVGAWSGLRAGANGSPKGGLPIPIFGGKRGDVPLERGAGELIADLVAEQRLSCVLDLSQFPSEADKKAFLLAFARRLYLKNEDPLHLFLEEADDYIPQHPMRDEAQLLRAWENIVRRGRARGIGITLITQRSAAINKMVLTQVETLFVLRTTGPQDIEAIKAWTKYHQVGEEMLSTLAGLEDGEAWVWSPHFLKEQRRFKFRMRRTFDTGATPKNMRGKDAKKVATLADVDLGKLKERLAATIERAKADDPKELRRRIAELEKAAKKPLPATAPAKVEVQKVEVPVPVDWKRLHRQMTEELKRGCHALVALADKVLVDEEVLHGQKARTHATTTLSRPLPRPVGPSAWNAGGLEEPKRPPVAPKVTNGASNGVRDPTVGDSGLCRMLIALAQRPEGLARRSLGLRAGLSTRTGTFGTYLSRARTTGWIEGKSEIQITDAGLAALGHYKPLPTGDALREYWLHEVGDDGGAGRMLRVLAEVFPAALARSELAERANLSAATGTFGTYLSRLRGLELIEGKGGEIRLSEELVG